MDEAPGSVLLSRALRLHESLSLDPGAFTAAALRMYSGAMRLSLGADRSAAIPVLEEAIALDRMLFNERPHAEIPSTDGAILLAGQRATGVLAGSGGRGVLEAFPSSRFAAA